MNETTLLDEQSDELRDYIYEVAAEIDDYLRDSDIALKQRPLAAAIQFVHVFVVAISDGEIERDKKDFIVTKEFAVIQYHFNKWYAEQYGEAFKNVDGGSHAVAIAEVRGIPVKMKIPLTRTEVAEEGKTAWVIFPAQVDAEEEPVDWLINPPNLSSLTPAEKTKLQKHLSKVAASIRCIRIYLMGAGKGDDIVSGLLSAVLSDVETAAEAILRGDPASRQSAMWPLHIACEKTLKALAQQKNGAFREIHNLFELFDDVKDHLPKGLRVKLSDIPVDRQQMDARYGQQLPPTEAEALKMYMAATSFIAGVAPFLERSIGVANARFLIKRAPWTEFSE